MSKGQKILYNSAELSFVKANCTLVIGELHKKFCVRFDRYDVSAINLHALRKRNGWRTGRTGRFEPGNVPHKNARPAGSNSTSFKKGSVPANVKPLYHERPDKDGYIWIKVPEVNPHTKARTRYVMKHRWNWKQAGKTIPDNHVLIFKDGNRNNCEVANLELLHRGELAILNKRFGKVEAPLKPVARTIAKVQHRTGQLASPE